MQRLPDNAIIKVEPEVQVSYKGFSPITPSLKDVGRLIKGTGSIVGDRTKKGVLNQWVKSGMNMDVKREKESKSLGQVAKKLKEAAVWETEKERE